MIAKLEEIAKKHKFANYGELDTVAGNIMLVLEGVDPQTKKYIGAEAELKKEIAALQANKQISAEDKKSRARRAQPGAEVDHAASSSRATSTSC